MKLTIAEELALVQWILSMDECGMAPTIDYIRTMANLLLAERGGQPVGINWVRKFVTRHDCLKARYSRRYDYQRAECEDPALLQEWFERIATAKAKYGIIDEDIYNFDEIDFATGVANTTRVLTRADRRSQPIVAQPGNCEWVIIIEYTNTSG
jgi:hypothetical protein